MNKQTLKKDNLLNAQEKDREILVWVGSHTGEDSEKKETPPHLVMVLGSGIGLIAIFISFLIYLC